MSRIGGVLVGVGLSGIAWVWRQQVRRSGRSRVQEREIFPEGGSHPFCYKKKMG
jgi:hypothetical protein